MRELTAELPIRVLIEVAALCLLPYLFRLVRSRNHIRIRMKLRRTPNAPLLIGIAVLIIAIAATI